MAANSEKSTSPFSLRAFVTAIVTVGVVVVVVLLAAYHTCGFEGCPSIEEVQAYVPDEASVVVDRDGEEIGRLFRVNRVVVPLDSLPENVPEAFIATEDQEFYDHGGVDWSRALGALWQNVRSGGIEEGFSTITMQVARNVFPEQLPLEQRTLNRKISEIKVARGLESRYTKDEILSLYLNQIYFGSGAWGIQAAAREYFGKPASELDLGEAALLAGLPQAPSRLNPRENMEGALERRRTVLRRMVEQGYISQEEADEVREAEPELARSRIESPDDAPYFMEHVRQVVEERLGDAVYTRGYTIHTTLDLDAQAVASRPGGKRRALSSVTANTAWGCSARRSWPNLYRRFEVASLRANTVTGRSHRIEPWSVVMTTSTPWAAASRRIRSAAERWNHCRVRARSPDTSRATSMSRFDSLRPWMSRSTKLNTRLITLSERNALRTRLSSSSASSSVNTFSYTTSMSLPVSSFR